MFMVNGLFSSHRFVKEPPEKNLGGGGSPSGSYRCESKDGAVYFRLEKDWTVETLADVSKGFLSDVDRARGKNTVIDLCAVSRLDTAGAMVVNEARTTLSEAECRVDVITGNERYEQLLETAKPVPNEDKPEKEPTGVIVFLNATGKRLVEAGHSSIELFAFLGQFLITLGKQALQPHKVRWTSLFFFMEQAGIKAIPIVSLLSFLIGMVVAYMGMNELAKFGAQFFSIKLLEVTILREMGILLSAIVVAGRSSSSFTAQIGSMVANEEVAAIRSMGLDPNVLLVLPRVVALILTFPLLVFIANVVAIAGGATAICMGSDISLQNFVMQFANGANVNNFFVGMIKAPFCALVIGLVGCFNGFKATTSAESVGFLTTTSVVTAIFLVIVIDAIFALFFATVGF